MGPQLRKFLAQMRIVPFGAICVLSKTHLIPNLGISSPNALCLNLTPCPLSFKGEGNMGVRSLKMGLQALGIIQVQPFGTCLRCIGMNGHSEKIAYDFGWYYSHLLALNSCREADLYSGRFSLRWVSGATSPLTEITSSHHDSIVMRKLPTTNRPIRPRDLCYHPHAGITGGRDAIP